jgi:hypothetical protein
VSETTAHNATEGLADLFVGSVGFLVQNGLGGEDHAAQAKTTLRGSFVDESLLDGVRFFGSAEAFEGGDFVLLDGADGHDAGADGFATKDDRACAALSEAATELGAAEVEFVAEDVQEWSLCVDVDVVNFAVNF